MLPDKVSKKDASPFRSSPAESYHEQTSEKPQKGNVLLKQNCTLKKCQCRKRQRLTEAEEIFQTKGHYGDMKANPIPDPGLEGKNITNQSLILGKIY